MRHAPAIASTPCAPHVRDVVDMHGVMRTVLVALVPSFLVGAYNTGYQANRVLAARSEIVDPSWRDRILAGVGAGRDASSLVDCTLLGASYVVPLLLIALAVGALWEHTFSRMRRRERVPGLAVTACIFVACLPPTLPWWQAALGISVAIVVGKEVFGGTGRNVFNPAVVGLAFLYFAYPSDLRADDVWIAAARVSEPPALRTALAIGVAGVVDGGTTWTDAFLGRVPGAIGVTSTLGCLVGGVHLVHRRVASWRIVLGVVLGATAASTIVSGPPWYWHLVLGSLAFAAVFLATDPATSATTDAGRWVYGFLIGALVVLIRVANPAHTEGVLFAVLLGNTAAPLIDRGVIWLEVRRRRHRLVLD